MSTFPPIADYAFLSDCENNCLVAPDGSIEWLSLPRPDSPSVFGALLDRNAGSFRLGPVNTLVPDQRRYIPGTMVLETTWQTPTGWLVVNDLFVVRPVSDEGRRAGYDRVPRVGAGVGTILRTATCISGKVDAVAMGAGGSVRRTRTTNSTPRCCCSPSWVSCRRTTGASRPRCWPSPTS